MTSNAATPFPGDWKGIYFRNPTKDDLTILDNCVIEYGGSTDTNKSNLYVSGSSPTIKNSAIRHSSGSGIILVSAAPTIENNLISENGGDGINADGNSSALMKENTLSNNGGVSISVSANSASRVNGNSGSGNGQDWIKVGGGNITTSGTWSLQAFPYIVTGDITVYHTSRTYGEYFQKLTIEPGVEVRFNPGTGLYIGKDYSGTNGYYGALDAQGTAAAPIIFTSNSTSALPGDWKGIYFRNPSKDSEGLLEHCIVEYAGHTHNANIYLASASPTVKNCVIQYSGSRGIYVDNGSSPLIQGTIFTGNADSPVNIHPGQVHRLSGNTGAGNGKNAIEVRGGNITASVTWAKQDFPYAITGDVTVYHTSRTYGEYFQKLTIEPGVEVRFNPGTGLYIGKDYSGTNGYYGALGAQGTAATPIIFTSNSTSTLPGDWKGIYFRNPSKDSEGLLEHCIIEFAGHTNNANIYLNNAKPTLQYNTIRNSSHSGIYVNGTGSNGAAINCNNLKDNHYGVYTISDARPVITGNNFLRNLNAGVYNASGVTVVAENNWWNDPNGANFNGDDASGIVDFTPLVDGRQRLYYHPTHQYASLCAQESQPGQRSGARAGYRRHRHRQLARWRSQPVGHGDLRRLLRRCGRQPQSSFIPIPMSLPLRCPVF